MNERPPTKRRFELSTESLGRGCVVTLQFASFGERDASTEVEAQIAAWVNEGGAGGEVRRWRGFCIVAPGVARAAPKEE